MLTADRGALAALRTALAAAGYTSETVGAARRAHRFVPASEELPLPPHGEQDGRLAALVALLALGRRLPTGSARAALAPARLEDLEAAGVLSIEAGEAIANCSLLPYDGLLLAGDAHSGDRDVVSAFTNPSATLARLTPRSHRRSMLDLGTGSGVLALLAAAHCDRVTAADVNPRALTFAGFNAALNEIDNVELLEGSWFEPVAGRRFELIVGNPPYVISPDQEFTYRDSGMPGASLLEQLCRLTVAHLEPGGLGILMASWPHACADDWAEVPSAWVSDLDCDALVVCWNTVEALEHAVNWNSPPVRFLDPESLRGNVARWMRYYREIGAGAISFGAIVVRRRVAGAGWVSALKASQPPGPRASEQLVRVLDGQDVIRALDDPALLAGPCALPKGIDVSQRFERRERGFVARPAMVGLPEGLGIRAAVDPDTLEVLFACDGRRTLREAVEGLAQRRGVEARALAEIAARAARTLLAHGLLDGYAACSR